MKHRLTLVGAMAAIALHFPVHADDQLDGLKKLNADGCVQVIALDKDAPKDKKLVKPYCTCVYDTYFNNFTQAEKNSLLKGTPASASMQKTLESRLQAAKTECRKKIGS